MQRGGGPFVFPVLRALGPVAAVVAPNLLHHMYLARTAERFPEAEVWAAPGVETRSKAKITHVFDGRAGPWGDALQLHALAGVPRLGETVILHPASGTLVLTDLCFNMRRVDGWFARTQLKMLDAYGRFGPSWLMRNVYTGHAPALRRSIDHVLGWDFRRVVVTHGDVLEDEAKDTFRASWAWLPG